MKMLSAPVAALCGLLPALAHGSVQACRVLKPDPVAFAECVTAYGVRPQPLMARAVAKETQLDVVDVLIAYDLSAQRWLRDNGKGTPEVYAASRIKELNDCLLNSDIDAFTFRLAGTAFVGEDASLYCDSTGGVDLEYILVKKLVSAAGRVVATGEWLKVADARASLGADIVAVMVGGDAEGTVGISYQLDSSSARSDSELSQIPAFGNWAYSVCSIQSVDTDRTLPHEIGHVMGCGHPDKTCSSSLALDLGPQIFDYSSGYYFWVGSLGYTTIMGYNYGGLRPDGSFSMHDRFEVLPVYSSPNLNYKGMPVGTSRNDNRKTLLKVCAQVAQYRVSRLSPEPADDPDPEVHVFAEEFRPTAAIKGAAPYVGVVYDGDEPVGVLSLKCGKAAVSGKKAGKCKVSAVVTGLNGKKKTARAVDVECGYDAVAMLDVKGWGVLSLTLGGEGFVGTMGNGMTVKTASVGGLWPHARSFFGVDFERGADLLPAGTLVEFLPAGAGAVAVLSDGGKWRVGKAATVKWAVPKGESEKRLVVDGVDGGNLSALKLSYAPKTGMFKGSFKVYVLTSAGGKVKLRNIAAKVTGFVLSGIGYGTVDVKKVGAYSARILPEPDGSGAE